MNKYSLHTFTSLEDAKFNLEKYSKLKFGSGSVAKEFGYELAEQFFERFKKLLLASNVVVYSSAYKFVPNAASLLTEFFVNRLNELLISTNGNQVSIGIINRSCPYIADYGKSDTSTREALLNSDTFTFDKDQATNSVLVFVDDCFITGTHHRKISNLISNISCKYAIGVYYAEYKSLGTPEIESKLNSAFVQRPPDLVHLIVNDPDYRIVVRTIKSILSLDSGDFDLIIKLFPNPILQKIYFMSIGEGYYKNINFTENFSRLQRYCKL